MAYIQIPDKLTTVAMVMERPYKIQDIWPIVMNFGTSISLIISISLLKMKKIDQFIQKDRMCKFHTDFKTNTPKGYISHETNSRKPLVPESYITKIVNFQPSTHPWSSVDMIMIWSWQSRLSGGLTVNRQVWDATTSLPEPDVTSQANLDAIGYM